MKINVRTKSQDSLVSGSVVLNGGWLIIINFHVLWYIIVHKIY